MYVDSVAESVKDSKAKLESEGDIEASCVSQDDVLDTNEIRKDDFFSIHKKKFWLAFKIFLLLGFSAYFITACVLDVNRAIPLIGLTAALVFFVTWAFISANYFDVLNEKVFRPTANFFSSNWNIIRWICLVAGLTIIACFIGLDVNGEWERLISAVGIAMFILFAYLGSWKRKQIVWRPLIWGVAIEFCFGFIVLRWNSGFVALQWISGHVARFLLYSDEGAKFVFGDTFTEHFFAMKVLPVIVFFASVMAILYHFKIMHMVILKISWVMQMTLGTSAAESLNAAGNIFLGQTEAPLLIRPFLPKMTKSELHAVMTGGFGTIAGSVMAAFIGFGISPASLMAASVMAAPTALALSKVVYPETEKAETAAGSDFELPESEFDNVIEAAAKGASDSIPLVANIAVAMIAFVSLLAFINNCFRFVGWMVGIQGFTFELVCSYILRPIAFLMGVPWAESGKVASLLGLKTFVNEFVAYQRLSEMIKLGEVGKRSETIATFALCGFANFSSIAIQLGGLGSMAPKRYKDLASIGLSAMLTGTMTTWMNAAMAGLLTSSR